MSLYLRLPVMMSFQSTRIPEGMRDATLASSCFSTKSSPFRANRSRQAGPP